MSTHVYLANKKRKPRRKVVAVSHAELKGGAIPGYEEGEMLDSQYSLISALLPPSVKEFLVLCEQEVEAICGPRHARGHGEYDRWTPQQGSIVLGGQRVAVVKPRVRGPGGEKVLQTYAEFQNPAKFDQQVFQEGLRRVSQRDYAKGLPKIAASFGFSKSTVSRSWVKGTEKQLEKLRTRSLSGLGIVAVFIDGKRFSKLGSIVALGVGADGRKHVLGIYQSSTEHSTPCRNLLDDLERRGLPEGELLFIVDGAAGSTRRSTKSTRLATRKNAALSACAALFTSGAISTTCSPRSSAKRRRRCSGPSARPVTSPRRSSARTPWSAAWGNTMPRPSRASWRRRTTCSRFTGLGSRQSCGDFSRRPTPSRASTRCSRRTCVA